ncbi:siphovirus Gp157 family protein [Serratia fonticola]|uniref:Siphovirus Gp157 family protein n=1 Tax=Serratia fonticola TaxID=47917 RepID=A0AAW3WTP3_SERFO|nr:siphovirus Gp157 family protein [Serratia fonticola]MBC3214273.1 siphovirus Gp157 family protein [Serratia fonticola]NYA13664.1 siphovirus Gp157 family protein [Serratia fonticola]NYA35124.1 siphovirus Gp157 family protein [Serratia fonticola]
MSNRTIDLALEISKLESLAADGEDLTPEMIADTLEGIEGMMEDKFDATMKVIRDFDAKAEACKKEAARLAERKKHWDRQSFALKKYLLECLQVSERKTFKTTFNTFTARKGSVSLKIDNVDLLPDEFVESHTEVITTTKNDVLKKALQDLATRVEAIRAAGEVPAPELLNAIPGAHLETGPVTLLVS